MHADDPDRRALPLRFCGDTIEHDRYWAAQARAERPAAAPSGEPQGGRCPLYRLRLADPLPAVHPDSVEPFDREDDLRERSQARLDAELVALFESLCTITATYRLHDLGDHDNDNDYDEGHGEGEGEGRPGTSRTSSSTSAGPPARPWAAMPTPRPPTTPTPGRPPWPCW